MRKIIDSTVPLSPEAPRRGPAEPRRNPAGRRAPGLLAPSLSPEKEDGPSRGRPANWENVYSSVRVRLASQFNPLGLIRSSYVMGCGLRIMEPDEPFLVLWELNQVYLHT